MPETSPLPQYLTVVNTSETDQIPSTSQYEIDQFEQINRGMEGAIYRVQVRDAANHTETLVLKKLFVPVNAPELKDKYDLAKQAGLPVPDRFVVANEGILMTDLSEGGRNLVLSLNDFKRSRLEELRFYQPDLMAVFSQLDIRSLEGKMQALAKKAADANLSINHEDTWFFVMEPSGDMKLILTDFLHLEKTAQNAYNENYAALSSLIPYLIDAQQTDQEDNKPFWQK